MRIQLFKTLGCYIRKKCEMKKWEVRITKNFKDLENHRKLTKEQKKEVQDFYVSMIGKKIPLYCHEYFYYVQVYSPKNMFLTISIIVR